MLFFRKCLVLLVSLLLVFQPVSTFAWTPLNLPSVGVMVLPTAPVAPLVLRGVRVHPDNPFLLDFIVDPGQSGLSNDQIREESGRLVRYFLSSLTLPERELWVNLSPLEADRIMTENFSMTEMGRDLLEQDYVLKQFTASQIHPHSDLGREFWDRVYKQAYDRYGARDVDLSSINKVWVIADKAGIYEYNDMA